MGPRSALHGDRPSHNLRHSVRCGPGFGPSPAMTASLAARVTQVVDARIASDPRFSRLGRARTRLPGQSSDEEARSGNPRSARSATSFRDASPAPYTACVKHAILGAGGVGGLIGAALARAGEDVVLLM